MPRRRRAAAGGRSGLTARAQLHHPPHRLRRADPDRRQPVHLLPVLHRQHARRHGAPEHRRQARDAGAIEKWKVERGYDKPLYWNAEGAGQRQGHATRSSGSARCRCSRSTSAAPTRERSVDIGHEIKTRMWVSLQLARAAVHPAGDRQHGVRAAAGLLPPFEDRGHLGAPPDRAALAEDPPLLVGEEDQGPVEAEVPDDRLERAVQQLVLVERRAGRHRELVEGHHSARRAVRSWLAASDWRNARSVRFCW